MTSNSDPTNERGSTPSPSQSPGDTRFLQVLKIILFAIIYQVCEVVWAFVSLFQAGALLLTGAPNAAITEFARDLTAYMSLLLRFVCQQTTDLPWPLGDSKGR